MDVGGRVKQESEPRRQSRAETQDEVRNQGREGYDSMDGIGRVESGTETEDEGAA